MLKHIFKMAWRRKKANSLIMLELLVAFLVLVAVSTVLLHNWSLYKKPLGFNYENTWSVAFSTGRKWDNDIGERAVNVLNMLSQMDEIKGSYSMSYSPFVRRNWNNYVIYNDKTVISDQMNSSDGAQQGIGMKLLEGRWFGAEDNGQNHQAVVINQRLKEALFGDETAIGKNIEMPQMDADENLTMRVVGVFDGFRRKGEFSEPVNQLFRRYDTNNPKDWFTTYALVMKPGVPAQFEEKLMEQLNAAAPDWDFNVQTWSQLRRLHINEQMKSIVLVAIVGGFLMLMVCFGLFGVLWQNVTRRTQEIGLRRALGATGHSVQGMIIMELVSFAILAVIVGTILIAQVPLLGVFDMFNWSMFIQSILLSGFLICALTALCALYPGYMAAKYDPAEALHFE